MFEIICPECGNIISCTEDDWECWRCGYNGYDDFDEEDDQ